MPKITGKKTAKVDPQVSQKEALRNKPKAEKDRLAAGFKKFNNETKRGEEAAKSIPAKKTGAGVASKPPVKAPESLSVEPKVEIGTKVPYAPAPSQSLSSRLDEEFGAISSTAPHLIVSALAGTGKTTTLIEGLKRIKGIESRLTPSPQQAAVWEEMAKSKGEAHSVCFCAFNKSIATELQNRMPPGCQAMTLHSLGNKAVSQAYGRVKLNQYRVQEILCDVLQKDIWELRKFKPILVKAVEDLVGLCKSNLIGLVEMGDAEWEEALDDLAAYYDIEMNGSREEILKLVPEVLKLCKGTELLSTSLT